MISVCLATHNGEKYLTQLIDSILPQLNEHDELIVSDDGSYDATIDILQSYHDARIHIFHYTQQRDYSQKHLSSFYLASANFNNALIHAKGDYIFLADQDDVWLPNKIENCVQLLQKYDIISHNFGIINEKNILLEKQHLSDTIYSKLSLLGYWRHLPFRGCCLAFNRKVYDISIPIPQDTFEHDCWIGMNAIMRGYKYQYLAQPLINYRRHSNNVSDIVSSNSLAFKLAYRMKLLKNIILHQI